MSEDLEQKAKDFIEMNMTEDLQLVIKKGTILYHGSLDEKLSASLVGGMVFVGLEPSISFWYILELQEKNESKYDIEITHGYLYEFIVNNDIIVTYLPKIEDQCTSSNMLHLQEVFKGDPFHVEEDPSLSFELTFPVDKIGTDITVLNKYIININCIRKEYNTEDVYGIYDWIRDLDIYVKKDEGNKDKSEEDIDFIQYLFQAKMMELKIDKGYKKYETDEDEMDDAIKIIKTKRIMEDIEPFNEIFRDFVISINKEKRTFKFNKKYLTKSKYDCFCKILIRSLNYYKNNKQMTEYKHLINEMYERVKDRESFTNYVTNILLEDQKH